MTLAYALKESKKGDEHTIADLSKNTRLHYMTTSDYLNLIEYVQENIPKIHKINIKGNVRIIVTDEIDTLLSPNERTLLNLFDRGAFTEETAISPNDYDQDCIKVEIEKKTIMETNAGFHLTTAGIIEGTSIAGKRAKKVTELESPRVKEPTPSKEPQMWVETQNSTPEQYSKKLPDVNNIESTAA